ncbi:hypothetical protein Tco_0924207 [Tanacetum coccineum]|uniref:Uncharacterized protein n=1 Tax=Tanacetum coccineum TaxID=301880 RepID=A0ABQ5D470_9ASTR
MERKIDEWEKSQNVSSKQTDRTDPPHPQAYTEQVNVVFTVSGKSDDPPKVQKDPPLPIIVKNKTKKNPIKASKRDYYVVKSKEYPFRKLSQQFVLGSVRLSYNLFLMLLVSGINISVVIDNGVNAACIFNAANES